LTRNLAASGVPRDLWQWLLCDLDGFKKVNDKFGHLTGNSCSGSVYSDSKLLPGIRPGWPLGGDEFVFVFPKSPSIL